MKAWVRMAIERARSCQEIVSGLAFMTVLERSESRGGAGADDLTRLPSGVAEAMRQLAGEIVGLAGPEDPGRAADGELDPPADDDPGLLAAVREHLLAGGRPGRVAFVQDAQLASGPLGGDQAQ